MARGDHAAQAGVPLVPVLVDAGHRVAAERLDHLRPRARGGRHAHRLLLGDSLQHGDRQAALGPAGHLEGAEDRRAVREARLLAGAERRGERGGGPDSPRVEELFLVFELEVEDLAPLEEERPLLLVEGLVGGQVDDRRVGFHLAEVGVHGGVEREIGREADLRVDAARARAVGSAAHHGGARAGLAEQVRHQLDVARPRQGPDAAQFAQLVHPPRVLARNELPLVLFLVARDPPPHVQAPHLLVLRPVAQLVQRDAELGGPPLVVVRDLAIPHRVPSRVPVVLAVPEDQVDLAAARGQVELEAGALAVVAVEAGAHHVHRVAVEVVAAPRVAVHLGRVVVRPDRHVDVAVVVEDLHLGGLAGGRPLHRQLLGEVPLPRPLAPRLVVEAAVDRRRLSLEARGV